MPSSSATEGDGLFSSNSNGSSTSTVINDWRLWCRLCATDDIQGNISVLTKDAQQTVGSEAALAESVNVEPSLTEAIEKYFLVNIKQNDDLPETLCSGCYTLVTSLINFSERVSKVQEMFTSLHDSIVHTKFDLHAARLKYGVLDEAREPVILSEMHYLEAKPKIDEFEENIIEMDVVAINPLESVSSPIEIKEEFMLEKNESKKKDDKVASKGGYDETNNDENELRAVNSLEEIIICEDARDEDDSHKNNSITEPFMLEETAVEPPTKRRRRKPKRLLDNNQYSEEEPVPDNVDESQFKYGCTECPRKFQFNHYLRQHLKFTHSKPEPSHDWPCPQCSRVFTKQWQLTIHSKVHLPLELRKVVPCPYCDSKFTSDSLRTHIKCVHMNVRPFICEECGVAVHTNGALKKHMLTHSDYAPFVCDVCQKGFKNKARLQNHLETHDPSKHICPTCGVQLNSRLTYSQHLLVHSDEKQHKCDYCGRAFKHSKVLKTHLLIHTGLKPYSCDFCERTFSHASNCRGHKKRMHPEELAALEASGPRKAYTVNIPKLDELRAITKTAGNLAPVGRKKLNKPTEPVRHICPKCGQQLSSRYTLQQHLLVHSDERKHKCDYCGRAFKHSKGLKSHLIIHLGLKPYSCNFCGRKFANGPSCRSHKKGVHPVELAALEAAGGGKTYTRNIPKLKELKAITKAASNLSPVGSNRGSLSIDKKEKLELTDNEEEDVTNTNNPEYDLNSSNDEQTE